MGFKRELVKAVHVEGREGCRELIVELGPIYGESCDAKIDGRCVPYSDLPGQLLPMELCLDLPISYATLSSICSKYKIGFHHARIIQALV